MPREQKTYLDLFLDNITKPKKKGGIYFGKEQEKAIVQFLFDEALNSRDKNSLFERTIAPAFKRTITGVLEMPQFHHLGRLNRDEVIESTYIHMIEKIGKFNPNKIGKDGIPVKAYSYFSTVAKNHISELLKKNQKILKNKADVETSIDLSILSEDTLSMMSKYDVEENKFEFIENNFTQTSNQVISIINNCIIQEEVKEKQDKDYIKLLYHLRYLITKWDKIEFEKKNEFMRILVLYTGLKQQQVSLYFKKIKLEVLDFLTEGKKPIKKINKNKKTKDEEEDFEDVNDELNNEEDSEDKKSYIPEINSMEDFEIEYIKDENKKSKEKWKNQRKA